MNRRSFLASIIAAGVAPAFVRGGILMPVREVWTPYQRELHPYDTILVRELPEIIVRSYVIGQVLTLEDYLCPPPKFRKAVRQYHLSFTQRQRYEQFGRP